MRLSLWQCREHGDYALVIDSGRSSTIVTPMGICRRYDRFVTEWYLSSKRWEGLIEEAECAREAVEQQEEASNE